VFATSPLSANRLSSDKVSEFDFFAQFDKQQRRDEATLPGSEAAQRRMSQAVAASVASKNYLSQPAVTLVTIADCD